MLQCLFLFPFDFKIVRLSVQVLLQNEAETSCRPGFFQRQKQNDCLRLQSKLNRHFFPFDLFLHVLTWVNFKWLRSKMNSGNPFALSLLQSLQHIAWIMYSCLRTIFWNNDMWIWWAFFDNEVTTRSQTSHSAHFQGQKKIDNP